MKKRQRMLKITLRKSPIGHTKDQKATCYALGLRKMRQAVVRPDSESVRGMVRKVAHLVNVEEVEC
jgi:large subunit ribosomal protein L30